MTTLLEQFKEPIKVGPHGHVRLVDVMGDDSSIVQAARVSYGQGTKTVNEDTGLIRYLMRHSHTTPLEMCEIKLHLKMPIHVARQWIRHRTASVNEYSTRYSEVPDQFEFFNAKGIRLQSLTNKQGSESNLVGYPPEWLNYLADLEAGVETQMPQSLEIFSGYSEAIPYYEDMPDVPLNEMLAEAVNETIGKCFDTYRALLAAGVARELARNVLPLATYTEMYWKIDLHNLLHFLRLRLDSHAQKEIREFAEAIWAIVKQWVPIAAKAFEDYKLNGVNLSAAEWKVISWLAKEKDDIHDPETMKEYMESFGLTNKREQQEFLKKLGIK